MIMTIIVIIIIITVIIILGYFFRRVTWPNNINDKLSGSQIDGAIVTRNKKYNIWDSFIQDFPI